MPSLEELEPGGGGVMQHLKLRSVVSGLVTLAVLSNDLSAQSISAAIVKLEGSATATAKADALNQMVTLGQKRHIPICSAAASVEIKHSLIGALERENALVYSAPAGSLSELEVDNYWRRLVGCVASLRDPSALPGLLGAIDTGGGAINGVVALGNVAVPKLLQAIDSKPSRGRVALTVAAGHLAALDGPGSLSPENAAALRTRLLATLTDQNRFVRVAAVRSLAPYRDSEVRSAMLALSTSDPATTVTGRGKHDYPVRGAARYWLKQDSAKAGNIRKD